MPRNWQDVVQSDDFSNVMRLVHLAMRQDNLDEDALKTELVRQRRAAYELELSIQAERAGCGSRMTRVSEGPTLSEMNTASIEDAQSIVNTYNYDLAREITKIREDNPRSNRHTYASRLSKWDTQRAVDKSRVITQYTTGAGRAMALRDFYANNLIEGEAVLMPQSAVCPICQGWINRGTISIQEASRNSPPYHVRCPHYWQTEPIRLGRDDCEGLII